MKPSGLASLSLPAVWGRERRWGKRGSGLTPGVKVGFKNFPRITQGFPDGSAGKKSACNAGDTGVMGLIHGLGRSPRGGNGNPLQHFCVENHMDRGAWWTTVFRIAESQT